MGGGTEGRPPPQRRSEAVEGGKVDTAVYYYKLACDIIQI